MLKIKSKKVHNGIKMQIMKVPPALSSFFLSPFLPSFKDELVEENPMPARNQDQMIILYHDP